MVDGIFNTNQPRKGREDLPGPPNVPAPRDLEPLVMDPCCHKMFMRLNPLTFVGTKNYIEVEGWLKAIEKVFRVLGMTTG